MNRVVEKLMNGEEVVNREPGNSMIPKIKHRQAVRIKPCTWKDVKKGDIVYCKVRGNFYTHLVKATNIKRGCLIGNNHGRINGWTKKVYGKIVEVLKN
ncbi:MAG: hypothetical protein ACOC56_06185 [Atribacterota bacterium]